MTAMLENVAHYTISETLGTGALGHVYLAKDTKLNRDVALKVLMGAADDPDQRRRFFLEARAIAALKHPNIVEVLDYADADAQVQYMALEALNGKSLIDMLNENGPLQEQIVLCVGHGLAAALAHAHGQNIVHGDIKPNNVVLDEKRVVLIDFGAMKVVAPHDFVGEPEGPTQNDELFCVVGTPGFMAPEQLRDGHIDQRVDIFAFGALLYNLTTGEVPYPAEQRDLEELHKIARVGEYRDPRDFHPLLTPAFCDLLADCLAPNPKDRPTSAAAVGTRLEKLLAAHGITDVEEVLGAYYQHPSLEQQLDLRTVDVLIRELKLALLRDLQVAVKHQVPKRIKTATNRLRYILDLFGEAERYFTLAPSEQPRFLKGRQRRHLRFFLLGSLSGLVFSVFFFGTLAGAGPWLNALVALILGIGGGE